MMCKRNIVFFQQQFVVPSKHRCPHTLTSTMLLPNLVRIIVAAVTLLLTITFAQSHAAEPTTHLPLVYPPDATSTHELVIGQPYSSFKANHSSIHNGEVEVEIEPAEHVALNCCEDRIWLLSSRHLTNSVCLADLSSPNLTVHRLDRCGCFVQANLTDYFSTAGTNRDIVIYVHGNRVDSQWARKRGVTLYNAARQNGMNTPVDWVIFSWPSEKTGTPVIGAREKAKRTDTHGLYLSWILRQHAHNGGNLSMIGYSFGARVITGSLHALAGGALAGRVLPGGHLTNANIAVGLTAPAVDTNWLRPGFYHGLATQNMQQATLMYNPKDLTLKNFWRISGDRDAKAMGVVGPSLFGCRADGTPVPVRYVDCSDTLGPRHKELHYYERRCNAGREMACMINSKATNTWQTTIALKQSSTQMQANVPASKTVKANLTSSSHH